MQTYLLLFVAMAAIFYFLILRPQQRAKRAKAELMSALTEGSEILTVGGIYGTVIELRDEDMDLEIAEGVVMRIDRRALGKARGWTFGIDLRRMDDTAKQGFHAVIGFGEGNRIVHIFFDPRKPFKIAIDKPLCLAARNTQIARQPKA